MDDTSASIAGPAVVPWMAPASAGIGHEVDRELQAARAEIRHLLSCVPVVIYRTEPTDTYRTVFISSNIKDVLGRPPSAFLEDPTLWASLIHPADSRRVLACLPQLLVEDRLVQEYRLMHADGRYRCVHDELRLVRDAGGTPLEAIGCCLDITERWQTREAVRTISEELSARTGQAFFETLVKALAHALDIEYVLVGALKGPGGRVVETIAACARGSIAANVEYTLDGTPCERVVGASFCLYPNRIQDWFPSDAMLAEIAAESYAGIPLFDGVGQPLGLLCVMDSKPLVQPDLVESLLRLFAARAAAELERLRADEDLRTSMAQYRDLFEGASDFVYTCDLDWRFTSVNRAGERLLGYGRDEMLRLNFADIVPPESIERVREMWQRKLDGGDSTTYQVEVLAKDGRRIAIEISSQLVRREGRVVGVQAIARDLTERVAIEQRLAQAEKMEAVGQLAGGLAHDFNNLLTVITGYGELLETQFDRTDPRRDDVAEIRKAAEKAGAIVQRLLAFGRRQLLHPEWLDVNAVVRGIADLLQRLLGGNVTLFTALSDGLGLVHADRGQLEQILVNLALNARDAMPAGGEFRLTTREAASDDAGLRAAGLPAGHYVLLTVRDTGTGMDATTQARVFEPFFTTKAPGKGTGLGLSSAYGAVRQMGGAIDVQSQLGRGTTFRVYVPAEPVARREPHVVAQAWDGGETILLVDDEAAARTLGRRVLEASGYRVLEAADGPDAIRLAAAHREPIDLLLTDFVMPAMNGRELVDRLSSLRPGLLVLYMSGFTGDELLLQSIREPGAALLQKPFALSRLVQRVREVLATARQSPLGAVPVRR